MQFEIRGESVNEQELGQPLTLPTARWWLLYVQDIYGCPGKKAHPGPCLNGPVAEHVKMLCVSQRHISQHKEIPGKGLPWYCL